ncbi:MAG: hypothetical protein WC476_06105 [Phycisphaerae bacterium]|jgi:hypothetical protein
MNEIRTYDNLKSEALIFWPATISEKEKDTSIIPLLLETQDSFISLLHIADKSPTSWKEVLPSTKSIYPNLFLKHLMILTDISGEKTKRFKTELPSIFDGNIFKYVWKEREYEYNFQTFNTGGDWSNTNLHIDGKGLFAPQSLSGEMEDITMLLMFGGGCLIDGLPQEILDKCVIGTLLGNKKELDTFVRQRYIWVSRITGGATANAMGHLVEEYIKEKLKNQLNGWDFSKKSIPGISQNEGRTNTSFDIVAESPENKYCAIEISFQVTTNSTIERKAGQAQARQAILHNQDHNIAYVIDGAGNFERRSALSTICQYSDCTVTFKDSEIEKLAEFLKGI